MAQIAQVAETLDLESGTRTERRAKYKKLQRQPQGQGQEGEFHRHVSRLMLSWLAGLFLAEWSGRLAMMLFSVFATLSKWKVNPRTWLRWYLDACAVAGGQAPTDIGAYLP